MAGLPGSDADRPEGFTPEQLDRTVLAIPLLNRMLKEKEELKQRPEREPKKYDVVLDIHLEYAADRRETREKASELVNDAIAKVGIDKEVQGLRRPTHAPSQQYLFGSLEGDVIREVVKANERVGRPIFRIWPDFEIGRL
jgi:serine protease AprX